MAQDATSSGAGQTRSVDLTLTNLGSTAQTFDLALADVVGAGVSFSVSPASLELGAGQSGRVTLTMRAGKGAEQGDHQAEPGTAQETAMGSPWTRRRARRRYGAGRCLRRPVRPGRGARHGMC